MMQYKAMSKYVLLRHKLLSEVLDLCYEIFFIADWFETVDIVMDIGSIQNLLQIGENVCYFEGRWKR